MSQRPPFLQEIKRRKVVRAVLVYLASAFAAIQAADVLFPVLRLPAWSMGLVVGLAAIGLPVVAALSWAFDLTGEGIVRDPTGESDEPSGSPRWFSARTALLVTVMLAIGVGAGWLARSASSDPSPEAGDRSIAVVPFDNLSSDGDNAFFAIGIQDEILTQLQKISDLRVISRSSAMRYQPGPERPPTPDIGRDLGARWIVEGSVARVGQEVRINVQLIESASDTHVWAEVYEGDLTVQGILAFQGQVARRVAESLRATVHPDEVARIAAVPTHDTEAYDLYLRGLQLYRKRGQDLPQAERYLEQAIARDSRFARAQAMLASVLLVQPYYVDVRMGDVLPRARAAAERAVVLDDALPEAHLALGHVHTEAFEWPDAERELRRARALDPNSAEIAFRVGWLLLGQGHPQEAATAFEQAKAVDPFYSTAAAYLAWSLALTGRNEEAVAHARGVGPSTTNPRFLGLHATVLGAGGARAGVAAILRHIEGLTSGSWGRDSGLTFAYLAAGDTTRALGALERADLEMALAVFINNGSQFDPIRGSPRFAAVMSRFNLDVARLTAPDGGRSR